MSLRVRTLVPLVAMGLTASGCSSLKNTWNYETTTAKPTAVPAPANLAAARAGCKTPLRVAVGTDPNDERLSGRYGFGGAVGWTVLGLLVAVPLSMIAEEPVSYNQMSWEEMYEIALYAELLDSGCFATVTWKPKNTGSYDLLIDPTLRRFGTQKKFPGPVPLPILIGTAFSAGFVSVSFLNEWDVVARRPDGVRVFEFGAEAACNGLDDCIDWEDLSVSQDLREQLRRGNTQLVDQLYGYFSSRSTAYWNDVHERTKERYFNKVDPDLLLLERNRSDPRVAAELEERREILEALWKIDVVAEDAWALSSPRRVLALVDEANQRAEAEYDANLKKAVVMAAVGAATLTAQAQSGQIQPTFMMDVDAKTLEIMEHVDKAERLVDLARAVIDADGRVQGDPVLELIAAMAAESDVAKQISAAQKRYTELVGTADEVLQGKVPPGLVPDPTPPLPPKRR